MSKHQLNRVQQSRAALVASFGWFAVIAAASTAAAGDWNTIPSTYTHSPQTGRRTNQYRPEAPSIRPPATAVIRSGYRQVRDSLNVGGVADNSHYVERFGEPVQPYGEWRFPYRPYSAPYPAWGPPVPHSLHLGNNFGGVGRRGFGGGFGGRGGYPRPLPHGELDPGLGGGLGGRRGIDPRRLPVPATPDRWRPWHDGGYPDLPRDYYQTAPEPYWPALPSRLREDDGTDP